jgi:predicted DNA-binding transcriptional regulator YafY
MRKPRSSSDRTGNTRRPLERIYRIHEVVKRGKYPNCRSLAETLEVTQKTVQRDISFMRDELDVPIEYDAVRHGYFYAKPVEGFPLLNTTAEDVVALLLARRALEPMQGTPLESSLRESFRRMAQGMRGRISVPWTDFDQAFSAKITGMSRPEISLLEKLAAAVLECREISFDYRKLGATEAAARSLRPYHLVEIDGGWYVIGHDVDRDARRTFAVPRMSNARILKRRFVRPDDFTLDAHLGGSFGIWRAHDAEDGKTFHVRLHFTGYAAQTVSERRWHPSQQIKLLKKDGSAIELRIELHTLEDVGRWVLSWGRCAKVIEPPALKKRVAEEMEATLKQYR